MIRGADRDKEMTHLTGEPPTLSRRSSVLRVRESRFILLACFVAASRLSVPSCKIA